MNRPLLSAHMCGPEGFIAPDTVAAAKAVADDGVDMVEFYVRVTKDNKFVVAHNPTVRVDGSDTLIRNLTEAEIHKHSPGTSSLIDILEAIKDHDMAHVDLKDEVKEVEIVDVCEKYLGRGAFYITSLEDESIKRIRSKRPHVQVGLSLGRDTRGMTQIENMKIRLSEMFPSRRVKACQPTFLAVYHGLEKYGVVRWAKEKNLPVLLWTLDSPDQIRKAWKNKNIWAFTTNNPRSALSMKDTR